MVTDVAFHTGIADPLGYACRLLRKAYRSGARVAVFGAAPLLERLDQALWTFDPLEFIPHRLVDRLDASAARERAPIVLVRDARPPEAPLAELGIGVGVGLDPPQALVGRAGFAFERIVEIVGEELAQRQSARQRWRAYEQAGMTPRHLAPEKKTPGEPGASDTRDAPG